MIKTQIRGVFSTLIEIFTHLELFPKKNFLYLQRCLYLHLFTVFRFTVIMKKLLKGMLLLSFPLIVASCAPKESAEVSIIDFTQELLKNTHQYEIFETDILHQPLIFTAGKAWLNINETQKEKAFIHSC